MNKEQGISIEEGDRRQKIEEITNKEQGVLNDEGEKQEEIRLQATYYSPLTTHHSPSISPELNGFYRLNISYKQCR